MWCRRTVHMSVSYRELCLYVLMRLPAEKRVAEGATRSRTLLFLFLQGTHALEMQRRFLLASSSSALFLLRRPFFAGCWFTCVVLVVSDVALACASVAAASMPVSRDRRSLYTLWGFQWRGAL